MSRHNMMRPLRQRQVLENCPVGAARDDGGKSLVVLVAPLMEPFVHLVAQSGIEGGLDLVPVEPLREALAIQEKDGEL